MDLKTFLENRSVRELKEIGKSLNIKGAYKCSAKNRSTFENKILEFDEKVIKKVLVKLKLVSPAKRINFFKWIPVLAIIITLCSIVYNKIENEESKEFQFKTSYLYSELSNKYPYGFKVFGLKKNGDIILGKNKLERTMEVSADWENLIIEEKEENLIYRIVLPDIKFRTIERQDPNPNLTIDLDKYEQYVKLNSKSEEVLIGGVFMPNVPLPFFEKLDDINNIPIYAIGWRQLTKEELINNRID